MRLIDAAILEKHYQDVIKDYESDNCSSFVKDERKLKLIANVFRDVLSRIKSQPTAYDIDKVVEELEKVKGNACNYTRCIDCSYNECCYEGEYSEHRAIDKAIELVKAGGNNK